MVCYVTCSSWFIFLMLINVSNQRTIHGKSISSVDKRIEAIISSTRNKNLEQRSTPRKVESLNFAQKNGFQRFLDNSFSQLNSLYQLPISQRAFFKRQHWSKGFIPGG